jgi:hypothetical protein
MGPKYPIIRFCFDEEWKILDDCLNQNPAFVVVDFFSAQDAVAYLSGLPSALVLASISKREDLIQIATFIKFHKKLIRNTPIKIVIFNFSNDQRYEEDCLKLGIQDVLDPRVNSKVLQFKIDFWMRALWAQAYDTESTEWPIKNITGAKANPEEDQALASPEISWSLHQSKSKISCELNDYFDRHIYFKTSGSGIEVGKEVLVELSFNYLNQISNLSFEGEVTEIYADAEGVNYTTVEISEADVLNLNSFLDLYQYRQQDVTAFLKRAKGL